jgi:GPH family glycoside/pentoside/hexuronide:cation symporter
MAYGTGQVCVGIKDTAFHTFLFFYFSQVLGLSASAAGLGAMIALSLDAVTDPVMGYVSDSWRSRWGRRHPFILTSAIPFGFSFYLLFSPPQGLGPTALFLWYTVGSIVVRMCLTLFTVPHLALGAELSTDYDGRTSVAGFRTMFSFIGGLLSPILAYAFVFKPSPQFARGQLDPSNYPLFGFTFGLSITVVILVCVIGTWKRIPYLPKPPRDRPPFRVHRPFVEIYQALRNRSFRWLFVAMTNAAILGGVSGTANLHINTFFWEYTSAQISVLALAWGVAIIPGIALALPVSRRFDKRRTVVVTSIVSAVIAAAPLYLRLLGLWVPNGHPWQVPLHATSVFLMALPLMAAAAVPASMTADLVDEHELKSKTRQEGIFYSAISFSQKATYGLGTFITGVMIDLIGFPTKAAQSGVPEDVLFALGMIVGPGLVVATILNTLCYLPYGMNRQRHAEIVRELEARRQDYAGETA